MNTLEEHVRRYPARPLPVALGQVLANTRPGAYLDCLNRLYLSLSSADKIRCRLELQHCREAKRGWAEARVA